MKNLKNIFKRKTKKQKIKKIREKEFALIKKIQNKNKYIYITKNKLKKKIGNSQFFTNIKSVDENGLITLKTNQLAIFFRIQPIDLSLTSKEEQDSFYYTLSKLYRLPITIKAYKFDERINLNINKEHYEKLIEEQKNNPNRYNLLIDYRNFLDFIEEQNISSASSYYFVIIVKNKAELDKYIKDFIQLCYSTTPRLEITQIDNKLEIYKTLTNMYFSDININQLCYYDLVDLIVPMNVKEHPSSLKIDNNDVQLVTIKTFPPFIEPMFLDRIINIPNVKASITIKDTLNKDKLLSVLNSSFKALLSDYNASKNLADVTKLKTSLDNYQLLIEQIARNDEKMKEVSIVLAINGTKEKREEIIKLIKSYAEPFQIKIDIPKLRQLEAWQCYDLTSNTMTDYAMYLPTLTLSSSFPFVETYHNDSTGYLIGEDSEYKLPIFFDPFYINNQRTSHNITAVGSTGSGKSFLMKKIIINEFARGTKLYIWDIENEYKKLVNRNGGIYIDLASKSLVNPLEIRYIPVEDEENENTLGKHLGFLESFFSTVFEEIQEKEMVVLLDMAERLYNQRGINKNTTLEEYEKLKSNDYPIFTDLYEFIGDCKNKTENTEELRILINIEILMKKLITGFFSIFNGITTFSTMEENPLIAFNMQELSSLNEKKQILNTQMLNVLTYVNHQIIVNKKRNDKTKKYQNIMLIADEFHKFIIDDNPVILNYFNQLTRRLRKYKSGLFLATQSPQDLISTSTNVRGATAIFNNSQYQLTGMLRDNDLSAIEKIYEHNKLTHTQKAFLDKANLGQFLLNITNKKRLRVNVFATPLEQYYMGEIDELPSEDME